MRTIEDLKEEIAKLDGMLDYIGERRHELLLKVQRKEKDEARVTARARGTDSVEKHLRAVSK